MTFSLLVFSFTAVQNLTKSAQLFFKDHWSISVLTLGKTLQLTTRQKLELEETRPFPMAMQDKNAWPKEAEEAISIPPFHREQIKACLSAPLIVPERNAKTQDRSKRKREANIKKKNWMYHSSVKPSCVQFALWDGLPAPGGSSLGCWSCRLFLLCRGFYKDRLCQTVPKSRCWFLC